MFWHKIGKILGINKSTNHVFVKELTDHINNFLERYKKKFNVENEENKEDFIGILVLIDSYVDNILTRLTKKSKLLSSLEKVEVPKGENILSVNENNQLDDSVIQWINGLENVRGGHRTVWNKNIIKAMTDFNEFVKKYFNSKKEQKVKDEVKSEVKDNNEVKNEVKDEKNKEKKVNIQTKNNKVKNKSEIKFENKGLNHDTIIKILKNNCENKNFYGLKTINFENIDNNITFVPNIRNFNETIDTKIKYLNERISNRCEIIYKYFLELCGKYDTALEKNECEVSDDKIGKISICYNDRPINTYNKTEDIYKNGIDKDTITKIIKYYYENGCKLKESFNKNIKEYNKKQLEILNKILNYFDSQNSKMVKESGETSYLFKKINAYKKIKDSSEISSIIESYNEFIEYIKESYEELIKNSGIAKKEIESGFISINALYGGSDKNVIFSFKLDNKNYQYIMNKEIERTYYQVK